MRQHTIIVPPGEAGFVLAVGDYVRIKSASVPVKILSEESNEYVELDQGDAVKLTKFSRLRITHGDVAEQTFVLMVGNGTYADSSKVGGSVVVSSVASVVKVDTEAKVFAHTVPAAVTPVAAQIIGVLAGRKFLMIQNKDAVGTIWFRFGSSVVTASNGVRLGPGETIVIDGVCTEQAIGAFGDIASNTNVLVVQG